MHTLSIAALGICGALVPELMRIIACLRTNRAPKPKELLASTLTAIMGIGVLLFDTTTQSRLEVAVLGSAFPQLFSGMVAAVAPPKAATRGARSRTVWDYLAWRLG